MSKSFAVLGDTQQTLLIESLVFRRERNPAEQKFLIETLAQEQIEFLVHLGDMVAWGANPFHWKYFDLLMKPLRDAKIAVHPVLGNHDYYLPVGMALGHIKKRFPQLKERTWYSKSFDSLGLIWIDSNRFHLGASRWDMQKRWFKDTLAHFESEPGVNGVLVFDHHPPHTNSKVNHDAKYLHEFVHEFVRSPKALAWISGHAQGYEHFYHQGKNFVVSGGGGGPRVKYHQGERARHLDLYKGSEPRPLNYLIVSSEPTQIRITAKGMQKGEDQVRVFDEIVIQKKSHASKDSLGTSIAHGPTCVTKKQFE